MRPHAVALWGGWRPRADPLPLPGTRIVMQGGARAGCLTLQSRPDCLWIDQLYLAPAFQGRGLGGAILRHAIAQAARQGLPLRLSVLTSNPALRFYQRHGFVIESETTERRQMLLPPPG